MPNTPRLPNRINPFSQTINADIANTINGLIDYFTKTPGQQQTEAVEAVYKDYSGKIGNLLDTITKVQKFVTSEGFTTTVGKDNFLTKSFDKDSLLGKSIPVITQANSLISAIATVFTRIPDPNDPTGITNISFGDKLRRLFGVRDLGNVWGPLAGAATGGLTGFMSGKDAGPLGMLTGVGSGALSGYLFGGPVGAAVGAGAGLIGGILGAIFGSRGRKEVKMMNYIKSVYEPMIESNTKRITKDLKFAGNAKYLTELNEADARMNNDAQILVQQMNSMSNHINAIGIRSKKGAAEAAKLRKELADTAKEQQSAIEEAQRAIFDARQERIQMLQEQSESLSVELVSSTAENFDNPLGFNQAPFYAASMQITYDLQKQLEEYKDNPLMQAEARAIAAEKQKTIEQQTMLEAVNVKGRRTDFNEEVSVEHLKAMDAGSISVLAEEKKAALEHLAQEIDKLRILYANNQDALTRITQLEADKRTNIEKDYQEKIQDEYKKTAQSLANLLQARSDIAGQFDFKRAKSRTSLISEQLTEVDKGIRENWREGVKDLQGLSPDMLAGMSADELKDIQEEIQTISNFSNSRTFNNVIQNYFPAGTPKEMVANIADSLNIILQNQAKLAM